MSEQKHYEFELLIDALETSYLERIPAASVRCE